MSTINQRIKILIQHKNVSKTEIAERLGITKQVVSAWIVEDRSIGLQVINQIRSIFPDVNIYWLIDGTGSMLLNSEPTSEVNEPPALYIRMIENQQKLIDRLEKDIEESLKNKKTTKK